MRSMYWQLGILRTISAFAYRHRENKKNLYRGGRTQDLPGTDVQQAVRHLKKKQQYTHSTTNTHKMTTVHTRQIQQYTQDNYKNTHKTTTTINTRRLITIHTRHLKIQHVQKGNHHQVKKVLYIVSSIFSHTYFTHACYNKQALFSCIALGDYSVY